MVKNVVKSILEPFLRQHRIELYDMEFVKEGSERYLRVYIDKEKGISLEDCERVSRFLSNALDKADPIKENYFLEVSSPGAERELRKDSDFVKFKDSLVVVVLKRLFEGQMQLNGILKGKDEEYLRIFLKDEKREVSIALEDIESVRNKLEF